MTTYQLKSPDEQTVITWDCGFRNPATDSNYLRIAQAIEESDTSTKILYSLIMANTRRVTFEFKDGSAPTEPIAEMQKFYLWAEANFFIREDGVNVSVVEDTEIIKASYRLFNRLVCNPLQEHWGAAYNKAQVLFPARQVFQPDSQLPAELIGDPDFLASGGRS